VKPTPTEAILTSDHRNLLDSWSPASQALLTTYREELIVADCVICGAALSETLVPALPSARKEKWDVAKGCGEGYVECVFCETQYRLGFADHQDYRTWELRSEFADFLSLKDLNVKEELVQAWLADGKKVDYLQARHKILDRYLALVREHNLHVQTSESVKG
jgi:hypothetical protein